MLSLKNTTIALFIIAVVILTVITYNLSLWLEHDFAVSSYPLINSIHEFGHTRLIEVIEGNVNNQNIFRYIFPFILLSILISLISSIFLLFWILVIRNDSIRNEKLHKAYRIEIEDLIIQYLYDKNKKTVRNLKAYPQDIIIDQILLLYKNLIGAKAIAIKNLFIEIGAEEYTLKRINSFFWHIRVKYLEVATIMEIESAKEKALQNVNSKTVLLSDAAIIAAIRLDTNHSFNFLKSYKNQLSDWQILKLYHMFTRYSIPVPDFRDLLNSKNDSIVVFALTMIRLFDQKDDNLCIESLLSSKNDRIRREAILVSRILNNIKYESVLIKQFEKENTNLKVEILKSLSIINSELSNEFIRKQTNHNDFMIKMEAFKHFTPEVRRGFMSEQTINEESRHILNHLSDNRI